MQLKSIYFSSLLVAVRKGLSKRDHWHCGKVLEVDSGDGYPEL